VSFVLDASTALSWCFKEEATPERLAVLQRLGMEEARVPALWPLEVANILVVAERRNRIVTAEVAQFLSLLAQLDIRIADDTAARALSDILTLAGREGLTSYDAAYLDLAMRDDLPLATSDRRLMAAAERCGVEVIRC